MSLTIFIGTYYIHDIDNHRNKSCYVEVNHGNQTVRTTSIPFCKNENKKKEGYVVNFSQLLELLVYSIYISLIIHLFYNHYH